MEAITFSKMNRSNSTGRRGRGRASAGSVQALRSQLNALKTSMHGHPNKLRHLAPPGFTKRPFNTMVVSHVIPEAGQEVFVGPVDVITFIKNQLGLADQTKSIMVFKLKRVDYYGTPVGSSTDRPSVTMVVSSLVPVVGDPATPGNAIVSYGNLYTAVDQGNLQESARLSYTFPRSMSDMVLGNTADFNFLSVASNVPNSELRFHVEWSTVGEATPVD